MEKLGFTPLCIGELVDKLNEKNSVCAYAYFEMVPGYDKNENLRFIEKNFDELEKQLLTVGDTIFPDSPIVDGEFSANMNKFYLNFNRNKKFDDIIINGIKIAFSYVEIVDKNDAAMPVAYIHNDKVVFDEQASGYLKDSMTAFAKSHNLTIESENICNQWCKKQ